jgi:hypothetical protein
MDENNIAGAKGAGFFSASITALRDIARKFQRPEHVAAYLALCRCKPGRGKWAGKVSTAGVKFVSEKLSTMRIPVKAASRTDVMAATVPL